MTERTGPRSEPGRARAGSRADRPRRRHARRAGRAPPARRSASPARSPATGSSPTSPPTSSTRSDTWPTPASSGRRHHDRRRHRRGARAASTGPTPTPSSPTGSPRPWPATARSPTTGSSPGGTKPSRDNLAEACDSSDVDPAARPGPAPQLRRGAVALRGRPPDASACSTTRRPGRPAWSTGPGRCSSTNPRHYLDDSTHRVGRYDIYTADVWLFTEPLADRLGDRCGPRAWPPRSPWSRWSARPTAPRSGGAARPACSPPRSPSSWPRWPSPAATPTVPASGCAEPPTPPPNLGPLVPRRAHHRPPAPVDLRVPRAVPAAAAHARHPRQAGLGREGAGSGRPVAPAGDAAEAYPWQDELIRFEDERPAARVGPPQPRRRAGDPVRRSHAQRLPARSAPARAVRGAGRRGPGRAGCRWSTPGTAPGPPAASRPRSSPHDDGGHRPWDSLVLRGELDPPATSARGARPGCGCPARAPRPGRSRAARSASTSSSSSTTSADAVTITVPETKGRPLVGRAVGRRRRGSGPRRHHRRRRAEGVAQLLVDPADRPPGRPRPEGDPAPAVAAGHAGAPRRLDSARPPLRRQPLRAAGRTGSSDAALAHRHVRRPPRVDLDQRRPARTCTGPSGSPWTTSTSTAG